MEPGWGVSRGADGKKKEKEKKQGATERFFGTELTHTNGNTHTHEKNKTKKYTFCELTNW